MAVDEGAGGERGSPGAGEAAAALHRLGRHPREDVLDQLVGEEDILHESWRAAGLMGKRRRPESKASSINQLD